MNIDFPSTEANQKSEPTEDRVTWSINRELLQSLKNLLEQIAQFGKDSDIKEFLSKFNELIRFPHVQVSIEAKNAFFSQLFKNRVDLTSIILL